MTSRSRKRKEPARHEGVRRYVPKPGLVAEVTDGLTNGKLWFSATRAQSGGAHRIKTRYLPLRKDRDIAQADLDKYAADKGWPLCD